MSSNKPETKISSLEPLFLPWEEPKFHRVKNEKQGETAKVIKGRRPSPLTISQNIRGAVREWRESFYAGETSDTSRQLLSYWFERSHIGLTPAGDEFDFHYYFCQREAIETLIYLKEVRHIDYLSQLVAEFGGSDAETAALGITYEEDAWSKYAFKVATGAGKTKIMSMAIVWSYFNARRESDSPMAKQFVVIAPNLTVYERLKVDFGDGKIFDEDPLIPPEWKGDWNMSIVLQDETSGITTGGILYLTNIHRLYDMAKRKKKKDNETYGWAGPPVSRVSALDTGAALRDRITAHRRIMILNDEAHHVWDPDSAWNEAISYLHDTIKSRTGGNIVCQLDFSATPKDDHGQYFKHIVCDTPLGEAVDAGIVKTPIIGLADKSLKEEPDDNAAYRFDIHLRLGYERWKVSYQEWQKSGKKALLFVMCENTEAADQIAKRLNTDEVFKELNGKTINLHTNLKGKVKRIGKGEGARDVFEESVKEISDEDLKALRKLSRELDSNKSPYNCIVSVLMLREGWDVRNVTTIVPLRAYSSKANILPEQTLGRGLRRITAPGQANELLTIVEHRAFASLYQQELAQEGLPIEIVDIDNVPTTTVSIYPDTIRKDVKKLDIVIPRLSAAYRPLATVENLTIDDIKKGFSNYKPLPLLTKGSSVINYEGRHLFTGEVIERMKIDLPLLGTGVGAISYYIKQLEQICKIRGLHTVIAPLLQTFLEEMLFERKSSIFDTNLIARLGDPDVAEYIRAVFVPLIRARTITREARARTPEFIALSGWKPYQVTHSERHPTLDARNTLFNLVPCNRELEVAVAKFADHATDVTAFAKNAGPQCLRIDYLSEGGRLAFYTPDFFIRTKNGQYYLIETKGRVDRDVSRKAKAAVAWCQSASTKLITWEYLYVPQGVFSSFSSDTIEALARTCAPALKAILSEEEDKERYPLFALLEPAETEEEKRPAIGDIVEVSVLSALPERYRKAADQASMLYRFFENKEGMNYAPVFSALLGSMDEAARGLIIRRLQPGVPATDQEQKAWANPYFSNIDKRDMPRYQQMAQNLKRTLIFNNGISPLGLLRSCLEYALNDNTRIEGVFDAIRNKFKVAGGRDLLAIVTEINDFRNTYVAHQVNELVDPKLAKKQLQKWINGLHTINSAA